MPQNCTTDSLQEFSLARYSGRGQGEGSRRASSLNVSTSTAPNPHPHPEYRARKGRRALFLGVSAAAALFVAGCIGFYWPTLAAGSVTLFLVGSLLFLVSALGSALLDHRR